MPACLTHSSIQYSPEIYPRVPIRKSAALNNNKKKKKPDKPPNQQERTEERYKSLPVYHIVVTLKKITPFSVHTSHDINPTLRSKSFLSCFFPITTRVLSSTRTSVFASYLP